MKNLFYSVIILIFFGSVSISAQGFANRGVWELGGMIGFSSTTEVYDGETGDDALTLFTFEPYVGYFVINCVEL